MHEKDIVFRVKEKLQGLEIVFTKIKLIEKQGDHPQLLKKSFLKCVERALSDPDEVWPDKKDNRKRCYYKKYSVCSYAKVVVWTSDEPYRVVSAYEIDKVKESQYPNLEKLL